MKTSSSVSQMKWTFRTSVKIKEPSVYCSLLSFAMVNKSGKTSWTAHGPGIRRSRRETESLQEGKQEFSFYLKADRDIENHHLPGRSCSGPSWTPFLWWNRHMKRTTTQPTQWLPCPPWNTSVPYLPPRRPLPILQCQSYCYPHGRVQQEERIALSGSTRVHHF